MEQHIEISEIDINDLSFNISRNILSNDLYESIKNYGMLEKPLVFKKNDRYVLMNCHNRIQICRNLGIKKIKAVILPFPDSELFLNNLILKIFRNGAGPAGRIKAVNIIEEYFCGSLTLTPQEIRKITGIPMEYIEDRVERERVLALPAVLLEYIDLKDINFKTIKDILAFDSSLLEWISQWLSSIQMRVNIFKKITDHLFDLARNNGADNLPLPCNSEIKSDAGLYEEIFRARYPEYSSMSLRAADIIKSLSSSEVSIVFPEFFEKDYISVILKITSRNRNGEWRRLIDKVDNSSIDDLLDLLG